MLLVLFLEVGGFFAKNNRHIKRSLLVFWYFWIGKNVFKTEGPLGFLGTVQFFLEIFPTARSEGKRSRKVWFFNVFGENQSKSALRSTNGPFGFFGIEIENFFRNKYPTLRSVFVLFES